jgi:hypothetical protein
MLSTLNHYQRIRKQNNVLLKNSSINNELPEKIIEELSTINRQFIEQLPFVVALDLQKASDLKLFLQRRTEFDNNLIRLCVGHSSSNSLKSLIMTYIRKERTYCLTLVT